MWDEGLYFVKRLDASRIRLAKSLTDISNGNFIELANTVTVKDNKIEPYKFNKKTLESQRILRSIHQPVTDSTLSLIHI